MIRRSMFQGGKLAARRGVRLLETLCHTIEYVMRKSNMKYLIVALHLVLLQETLLVQHLQAEV